MPSKGQLDLHIDSIPAFKLDTGVPVAIEKIEELMNENEVTTVSVGGGSGSGKTTQIAENLLEHFGKDALLISLDDYYRGVEFMTANPQYNLDQPEAMDLEMFAENIRDLKAGKEIQKPIYSMQGECGKRVGFEKVKPRKLIIVEGIFTLHSSFADEIDLKIFAETKTHGRLLRRLVRDGLIGGRTGQNYTNILKQFLKTVRPMHDIYIEPTKENASLIISNEYNPLKELEKIRMNELRVKFRQKVDEKLIEKIGGHKIYDQKQTDTYYNQKDWDLLQNGEILKIRKDKNSCVLSYKVPSSHNKKVIKSRLDIEVDDGMIELFNKEYENILKIKKRRKIYKLENAIVTIDEIEKFGDFTEIRVDITKTDEGEAKQIVKKLNLEKENLFEGHFFDFEKESKNLTY